MTSADLIIVGAGLAGSAAAWAAAGRGMDAVVLEAFEPGHRNGSSHGSARIFRYAYADPLYIRLAGQASTLWRKLEEESGETLLTTTGGLDYGRGREPERLHAVMADCGVAVELLEPEAADERWPGFRFPRSDGPVVFHPDAGVLDSDRAMAVMLRAATGNGARVLTGARVTRVEPAAGGGATVRTEAGEFTAPVAVLAAGAWLAPLVEDLLALPDLTVTQEQILHLPRRAPRVSRVPSRPPEEEPWPVFNYANDETCFFGLLGGRDGEEPGAVKLGEHHAGPVTTADSRDFAVDPDRRRRVLDFAGDYLPGLDNGTVLNEATCLYTTTASEDFILDRQGPLVIASACSGHGAKFAPLLGEIIADLAQGRPAPVSRFTLAAHLGS
ncbi:MAG: FAD-dependent oxidoreductase [Nocardiopsaceae bacterium]|nr:FAD-dependent oxidoreductase [Nocardiopsaceae bacterium]